MAAIVRVMDIPDLELTPQADSGTKVLAGTTFTLERRLYKAPTDMSLDPTCGDSLGLATGPDVEELFRRAAFPDRNPRHIDMRANTGLLSTVLIERSKDEGIDYTSYFAAVRLLAPALVRNIERHGLRVNNKGNRNQPYLTCDENVLRIIVAGTHVTTPHGEFVYRGQLPLFYGEAIRWRTASNVGESATLWTRMKRKYPGMVGRRGGTYVNAIASRIPFFDQYLGGLVADIDRDITDEARLNEPRVIDNLSRKEEDLRQGIMDFVSMMILANSATTGSSIANQFNRFSMFGISRKHTIREQIAAVAVNHNGNHGDGGDLVLDLSRPNEQ